MQRHRRAGEAGKKLKNRFATCDFRRVRMLDTSWGGMKMFLQNQIPPDDARRETVYQNFNSNLRDIVHLGTASGAKIVLSTMSVTLRDSPPFGSMSDTI